MGYGVDKGTMCVHGRLLSKSCTACATKAYRHPARPGGCPCVCNSGQFCGGCGHAGCGLRGADRPR